MEIFASSIGTKRSSRYATPRAPKPAPVTRTRYQRREAALPRCRQYRRLPRRGSGGRRAMVGENQALDEIGLSDLPLVDHHCHGVVAGSLERSEFENLINEGLAPPPSGASHCASTPSTCRRSS